MKNCISFFVTTDPSNDETYFVKFYKNITQCVVFFGRFTSHVASTFTSKFPFKLMFVYHQYSFIIYEFITHMTYLL